MNYGNFRKDSLEFLSQRAQAEADERAEAEWERKHRIEHSVTLNDLLEELETSVSPADAADFMETLACGDRYAAIDIFVALNNAKERIIKRLMTQGD